MDTNIVWLIRGGAALLLALTTSCNRYGQCDGKDYFIYTANSSSPELFHEDRGRALLFAHPPDAGAVLYQYDGARLAELASLPEEPVAWATLEGSSVVLTRGGLWRLGASDRFEVLKRFDVPLPDASCAPKTDLLVELGGRLVFVGPDAAGRAQLWVYQPASDTIEIVNVPRLYPDSSPCSDITQATVVGDRMIFSAGAARPWGMPNTEWWSYDGHDLQELLPGPYRGYDAHSVLWQGHLWLRAFRFTSTPDAGSLGDAVAVYDGGVDAPAPALDLNLSPVGAVGDTLVLLHEQPLQLWTYDAQGFSVAVPDLEWCRSPNHFTAVAGRLYFTCFIDQSYVSRGLVAFDPSHGRVDVLLRQGVEDANGGAASALMPWKGHILFAGSDTRQSITQTPQTFTGTGTEPWTYDIATGVASRIEDLSPGSTLRCDDL